MGSNQDKNRGKESRDTLPLLGHPSDYQSLKGDPSDYSSILRMIKFKMFEDEVYFISFIFSFF